MNTDSPEKVALKRAADVLGSQAAIAEACGVERRSVWPWFQPDRRVPTEHCPAIEQATREKGAPVLCEELRPDVNWAVLRNNPLAQVAANAMDAPEALHGRSA